MNGNPLIIYNSFSSPFAEDLHALTLPWSNEQVEGQINKLKTINVRGRDEPVLISCANVSS